MEDNDKQAAREEAAKTIASVSWLANTHRPGTVKTFSPITNDSIAVSAVKEALSTLGYDEYRATSTGSGGMAFSGFGNMGVMYGAGSYGGRGGGGIKVTSATMSQMQEHIEGLKVSNPQARVNKDSPSSSGPARQK